MRVAIFGAGPAGLLIAHASEQLGHEPTIFSAFEKSTQYGAQYLHQNIPGIPNIPVRHLEHQFTGTIPGYRDKVYGMAWDGVVSPEQYSGVTLAYDIRYAYDWLWQQYRFRIIPLRLTPDLLMGIRNPEFSMTRLNAEFDIVFSTIPRAVLCASPEHRFNSAKIWCIGDAPDQDIYAPIKVPDETLICSGDPDVSWYRACRVFDHTTVEWPRTRKRPPIEGVVQVLKPLDTNCTCWPEIKYLGRYGEWKKGVLVHEVYRDAIHAMKAATVESV